MKVGVFIFSSNFSLPKEKLQKNSQPNCRLGQILASLAKAPNFCFAKKTAELFYAHPAGFVPKSSVKAEILINQLRLDAVKRYKFEMKRA